MYQFHLNYIWSNWVGPTQLISSHEWVFYELGLHILMMEILPSIKLSSSNELCFWVYLTNFHKTQIRQKS